MGYEIHIERDPPLTLDEWKAAVRATEGVRLNDSGASATNPRTREVVSIAGVDGDAEVDVAGRWLPCFRWRRAGSVVFRASRDFTDAQSPLRRIARELASKLDAAVRGDDGERYD
jgi:hypothetical protein